MSTLKRSDLPRRERSSSFWWSIVVGCLLITVGLIVLLPRVANPSGRRALRENPDSLSSSGRSVAAEGGFSQGRGVTDFTPVPQTAEQSVAAKVAQFGRSRRGIVHAISRRYNKDVPPEIEEFFDAIEKGEWAQIDAIWQRLAKRSAQYEGSTHSPELDEFWPAVLEAYGAAEAAHLWPAQKLLDYGQAVLGSLRPGMVYVGGSDPGRFIPTLLNETSGEEPHIVLTQNALADSRYQEYLRFLYGDRFGLPSTADSERAFQEYMADAQKRLEHDRQFPDEPRQVRPGEDIKVVDGKVQVAGQVAVMAINDRLLQMILEKNPEASFGLQESFPLTESYTGARPLGPILELRADSAQGPITPDTAAQFVEYWRGMAAQLLSDPEAPADSEVRRAYGHMAEAQANLLTTHHLDQQAEQAYRLASTLSPDRFEAVKGLSEVLVRQGRTVEAGELLDRFAQSYPNQSSQVATFRGTFIFSAPQGSSGNP